MKLLYTLIILLLSCSTEPEVVHGCLDSTACNYNSSAIIDNNSCAYESDCAGVCNGSVIYDACGVCDEEAINDCLPVPNSSMLQAFYFFSSVTLDGMLIDLNDWVQRK